MPKAVEHLTTSRRRLFSGAAAVMAAATVAGAGAGSAAPVAAPTPARAQDAAPELSITAMARRAFVLDQRHDALDELAITLSGEAHDAAQQEMDDVYAEITALEERVLMSTPQSATEALIVLMFGVQEVNSGNACLDGTKYIARGERAIRRATRILATTLGVDLTEFGASTYLPLRFELPPGRIGRAA